ncbi:MAG TPA: hypothetical protein DEP91_05420, partial [Sphingomonas bacterium]|nr:hypothetical protein [Sphingomonas bacterium]
TPIILTDESACTSSALLPAPRVRMLRSTVASRVKATVLLVSAAPPATSLEKPNEPALSPKIAKMNGDLIEFAEAPRDVKIVDEAGKPLLGGDTQRRFFEGSWLHKYNGKYYLSYSTGDTHNIVYATSDNVYGPYTYRGVVLKPVNGWTSHHSIVEWKGKWWLFYHDVQLSGDTRLRNVKMTELKYNPDGSIQTIDPFAK